MRRPLLRPLPPLARLLMMLGGDFISMIVFAVVLGRTHSLGLSLAMSLASGVAGIGWTRARGRPVDAMQWLSVALVVVFGGASLLTHDMRFVMFKPTVIYLAVAAVMLKPGWMRRYLPEKAKPHGEAITLTFGYVWAAAMATVAGVNLGLALHGDLKLWAAFLAVGPLVLKLGLTALQYVVTRQHVIAAVRSQTGRPELAAAA